MTVGSCACCKDFHRVPSFTQRGGDRPQGGLRSAYEIGAIARNGHLNGESSVDAAGAGSGIQNGAQSDRVLAEAFRVLKPGGRFAVSDVVIRGSLPSALRGNIELWIGCVAGALEEQEYRRKLTSVGFIDVSVEPTRVYRAEDARGFLAESGLDSDAVAQDVDGKFMSAFVRARKPVGR